MERQIMELAIEDTGERIDDIAYMARLAQLRGQQAAINEGQQVHVTFRGGRPN